MRTENESKKNIMRLVDIAMPVMLLLLMAMQVTYRMPHEWLGIGIAVLFAAHHILNCKFYKSLFKVKNNPVRIFQLIVDSLLLISILITPVSGMLMSGYATPFMNVLVPLTNARELHLAFSYWSFILMGVHIGMHFGIITAKLPKEKIRIIAGCVLSVIAAYGFRLFLDADVFDYMFFKLHFAFFDYNKAWWIVLLENALMLLSCAFMAYLLLLVLRSVSAKEKKNRKKIVMTVMFAAGIALIAGAETALHFFSLTGF